MPSNDTWLVTGNLTWPHAGDAGAAYTYHDSFGLVVIGKPSPVENTQDGVVFEVSNFPYLQQVHNKRYLMFFRVKERASPYVISLPLPCV